MMTVIYDVENVGGRDEGCKRPSREDSGGHEKAIGTSGGTVVQAQESVQRS